MERIESKRARQLAFSKHRSGLFKKANELSTLCATDIAMVAFSPDGKPYSYGSPSVEAVTSRFLNEKLEPEDAVALAKQKARIEKLKKEYIEVCKELESEKKRGEKLDKAIMKGKHQFNKLMKPVSELNMPELKERKASLKDLKNKVKQVKENEASSSVLIKGKKP